MATAPSSVLINQSLLEMFQRAIPSQDRAIEIYRRLLEIHNLSAAMNAAINLVQLTSCLSETFGQWMPDESVRLCLVEDSLYRRTYLSGPDLRDDEGPFSLDYGLTGTVLRTGNPANNADMILSQQSCESVYRGSEVIPRSLLIVPFFNSSEVSGCLELISGCPRRFDDADYHLVALIAGHLSSCLRSLSVKEALAEANSHLKERDRQLTLLNRKLAQLAQTDEATGLFNKRRLLEQLDAEIARARRYGDVLSCLMIDIDHFKDVNDSFGHQAGDQILCEMGALLKKSVRVTDFVARYGGEEFMILLPRTGRAGAYQAAENLRKRIKTHAFSAANAWLHLAVSIGIGCCTKFDELSSQDVILTADSALYRAKHEGRDRVCLFDEGEAKEDCQLIGKTAVSV